MRLNRRPKSKFLIENEVKKLAYSSIPSFLFPFIASAVVGFCFGKKKGNIGEKLFSLTFLELTLKHRRYNFEHIFQSFEKILKCYHFVFSYAGFKP